MSIHEVTTSTAARRSRLREILRERELDALLVTDLLNIRYLTGFTGSNAALIVSVSDGPGAEDRTVIATDGRYLVQVGEQVPDLRAEITRACAPGLLELATAWGAGRLGFESHVVTVDQHAAWRDRVPGIDLVRSPGIVEQLREVKDEGEIELLRRACAAADDALATLVERGGLRPGRTEREVARELEWLMFEHGADGISFETIVAAGPNSAVPHHRRYSAPARSPSCTPRRLLVDCYLSARCAPPPPWLPSGSTGLNTSVADSSAAGLYPLSLPCSYDHSLSA